MRYYLGLDAGGTKTFCLIGDEQGHIKGFGRGGAGNYEVFGVQPALVENRKAVEGAVTCSLRLQQWDDALTRAQQFIEQVKAAYAKQPSVAGPMAGNLTEAIGERFLAGLYMTIPHEGTKRGSTYLRGQWTQGVHVSSWRKDHRAAVEHYERARQILVGLAGLAAGALGALIVALGTSWPVGVPVPPLLASLGMAVAIGIGAGALPARKASLIPPIQALLST